MRYIKCKDPFVQYLDIENNVLIPRGEIVALPRITRPMTARLQKGALVEVSKAEYEASLGAKQSFKASIGAELPVPELESLPPVFSDELLDETSKSLNEGLDAKDRLETTNELPLKGKPGPKPKRFFKE